MRRYLLFTVMCTAALTLLAWSPVAWAQHIHIGGGHGHGHGHSSGHGHNSGHGHSSGHGHGHSSGHGHHGGHIGHHFVVPHIDSHHHHGSYWVDSGRYYYQPRTYVTDPRRYVVAKPITVEFGSFSHVDDLAGRLERLVNQLCLDMHYNYSHNPGYSEAYRDAYQILDTAKYIHAKEHQNDRAEVARRLAELDPLFHHVSGGVQGWSRQDRRQIGQAGVMGKLEVIEATLHHLMNDAGVRPDDVHAGQTTSAPSTGEIAPPPSPPGTTAPITTPPPSLQ